METTVHPGVCPAERDSTVPVVWSVAGNDSGGGAGLSADQRAAQGCGVHLCPVVASVTVQNSVGVQQVVPVAPELLAAQLAVLAEDLRPQVIKTGLIGSAAGVQVLVEALDRLRAVAPVALVVDPVLGASAGGAAFADAALLAMYREQLLPRATLITPNRREAARLLGLPEPTSAAHVPALARALRAAGAQAVCITGGDSPDGRLALDWLDTPHAQGWLSLPRVDTHHHHGTGCTFATTAAAAVARGFVSADAVVLAKMATTAGLRVGYAAGQGAGPVGFDAGFVQDPRVLPQLSCDEAVPSGEVPSWPVTPWPTGVYAIVDAVTGLRPLLAAQESQLCAVQLRIKRERHAERDAAAFAEFIRAQIDTALAWCAAQPEAARPRLVVNDHHEQVLADIDAGRLNPAQLALHLGQEDLLSLGGDGRARLAAAQAQGLALGLSSHSLWELCRATAMHPVYIACGPVWATTTKDMPWHPQGVHNLGWWARMAPVPVVGIGGVLEAEHIHAVAATGAANVCLVRAVAEQVQGPSVAQRLAAAVAVWQSGRATVAAPACCETPWWPRPSLTA